MITRPQEAYFLSTRTLPFWIRSRKNSLTEHPARPEEAQAHAQAQLEAQAQWEAQEDAHEECDLPEPPERRWPEERTTGTGITLT